MLQDRLVALMNARGWTQNELAEESGVPQGTISNIVSGKVRAPRIDSVEALAEAFGVTVSYLLGKADGPSAPFRQRVADLYQLAPDQFPIYDQEAGAGPGVEVADYGFTEPGMEWRDVFGVRAKGTSMEPEVRDGDLLIVARDKAPGVGDIVLATVDGGMVAKRLTRRGARMVLTGDADGELPYDAAKVEGTVVEIRRRPR